MSKSLEQPSRELVTVPPGANGSEEAGFDYETVQEDDRNKLRCLACRIRESFGRQLMSAVDLGNDLLEAKAFVGHRNFLPWLRTEFQWSERKARYYMRIALHFDGKVAKFADLDLDTANTLIAKSTPDEVRDQLFARAEAKQPITRAEVKTAIAGGKAARRMAGAAARQAGSSEAKSGSAIAEDPETVNDDGETADDARSTAKKSRPRK